jgi:tetratricopeptide (TPR) repeat protein
VGAAAKLARRGHFKEAGEGFKKTIAKTPDEHFAWYYQGCLLAYQQDVAGYRKHCKAMLEKFGGSESLEIADRTAKTCLLLPEGGDPKLLLAMADRLLAKAGDEDLQAWLNLLKALAQYRMGDDRGCLDAAQKCKDFSGRTYAARAAATDLLLAMASQRLGRPEEARAALEAALARIKSDLPALSDEQPLADEMNLEDWLICLTLRHEAEGLIAIPTRPQQ